MSYLEQEDDVLLSDDEGYDPENDFVLQEEQKKASSLSSQQSSQQSINRSKSHLDPSNSSSVYSGSNTPTPTPNRPKSSIPAGPSTNSRSSGTPNGPRIKDRAPLPPQSRQYGVLKDQNKRESGKNQTQYYDSDPIKRDRHNGYNSRSYESDSYRSDNRKGNGQRNRDYRDSYNGSNKRDRYQGTSYRNSGRSTPSSTTEISEPLNTLVKSEEVDSEVIIDDTTKPVEPSSVETAVESPNDEVKSKTKEEVKEEVKQEVKEEVEKEVKEEADEEESDYEIGEVSDIEQEDESPTFTEAEKNESKIKLEQQNKVKQNIPKGIHLFLDFENKTEESLGTFTNLERCTYSNKSLGDSYQNEVFSCECQEDFSDGINSACIDEDCINRGTKIECVNGSSNCGDDCANQRFQKQQYANISVIKTEKKGYGVRSEEELEPDTFVYEYIGEVIDEKTFKKRMIEYDVLNLKHFYFMMLQKGEFIDATRKGSLGRFCNHSCNPNCYVEKWVVDDKLKMGIFTKRKILRGEELTFNYNVDRYGADAQKCYCGEPNCIGFIGGKTQTESASLLPHYISEALGSSVEEEQEFIKKKQDANEPLEKNENNVNIEFVQSLKMKPVQMHEANSIMGALLQCEDELIASKLIERLEFTDTYNMKLKLSLSHGYSSLSKLLKTFYETYDDSTENHSRSLKIDVALTWRIYNVLESWPPVSRDTIRKAEIIPVITELNKNLSDNQLISSLKQLLAKWDGYEERKSFKRTNPLSSHSRLFDDRRRHLDSPASESESPAKSSTSFDISNRYIQGNNNQNNLSRTKSYGDRLPHNWIQKFDRYSVPYYLNTVSGATQSERPVFTESDRLERGNYKLKKEKEEKEKALRDLERQKSEERNRRENDVLRVLEKAKKAEEERIRKEADALREAQEKAMKKEEYKRKQIERKKRALEAANESSDNSSQKASSSSSSIEKEWKVFFGQHIPNMVSNYGKLELSKEQIKDHSKDIVGILIQKELRSNNQKRPPEKLEDLKRKKVKEFVSAYVTKSIHKLKKRKLDNGEAK